MEQFKLPATIIIISWRCVFYVITILLLSIISAFISYFHHLFVMQVLYILAYEPIFLLNFDAKNFRVGLYVGHATQPYFNSQSQH